jgi:hypothetical protein
MKIEQAIREIVESEDKVFYLLILPEGRGVEESFNAMMTALDRVIPGWRDSGEWQIGGHIGKYTGSFGVVIWRLCEDGYKDLGSVYVEQFGYRRQVVPGEGNDLDPDSEPLDCPFFGFITYPVGGFEEYLDKPTVMMPIPDYFGIYED